MKRITIIAKTCLTAFIFITCLTDISAQTFNMPALGLKSHQTMEVLKVETDAEKTIVYLSIENRINGGTFCADKNIYLIDPGGIRLKLEKASGIPQCPGAHRFKKVGEILEFSLVFPALKDGTGWIDLIEECNDLCFSVFGILLNNDFTRKIDEVASHVDRGQVDTAIGSYQRLINDAGDAEAGITGSLYCDLIYLLVGKGYYANAADWYRKLLNSNVPRKELYIDNLNFRGIKY